MKNQLVLTFEISDTLGGDPAGAREAIDQIAASSNFTKSLAALKGELAKPTPLASRRCRVICMKEDNGNIVCFRTCDDD
jgi:hypothetical protein